MSFTNVFYYIYFILFSLHNEFTYTKCSLLSRVKNPVEHILTTTPESSHELPRNIYRYEPYKGHKTLWRPTSTNKIASLKQQRQFASRTRARVMKQQNRPQTGGQLKESSTIQSYWHHFDDDEEAWPKVVLLVSSTERTTTRRKQNRKTFATYFPHLSHRYTTTENTNSENDNDNNERDNVTEIFKTKGFSTNSISRNSDRFSDNVIHLRVEDDTEMEEARRTNVNTTNWKNSSNIERKIIEEKAEAELKKEKGLKTREELKKEEKVIIKEKPSKVKKISKGVKINKKQKQKPKMALKTKAEEDREGKNKEAGGDGPRCYQCGLNVARIPGTPTCHHVFSGDERKYVFLKPKYKVKCEKSFKGGCFRRFLDIGIAYDERGCRTMPPTEGQSFASKRMARLERSMHSLSQGCFTSPHASLTPFSRAVSLFARYHVCVCIGRYCNQGNVLLANSLTFVICFFSTTFAFCSCLIGWS